MAENEETTQKTAAEQENVRRVLTLKPIKPIEHAEQGEGESHSTAPEKAVMPSVPKIEIRKVEAPQSVPAQEPASKDVSAPIANQTQEQKEETVSSAPPLKIVPGAQKRSINIAKPENVTAVSNDAKKTSDKQIPLEKADSEPKKVQTPVVNSFQNSQDTDSMPFVVVAAVSLLCTIGVVVLSLMQYIDLF